MFIVLSENQKDQMICIDCDKVCYIQGLRNLDITEIGFEGNMKITVGMKSKNVIKMIQKAYYEISKTRKV